MTELVRYVSRRAAPDDVHDIVAETFLTAWSRFEDLPQDPVPWLFGTARRLMANRHRSNRRRGALQQKLAAQPRWVTELSTSAEDELDTQLLKAIAGLPDAEREAFMLVAWEGLDPTRASRAAGCSAATFRVRLHRARKRLMRSLREPLPSTANVQSIDVNPTLEETR